MEEGLKRAARSLVEHFRQDGGREKYQMPMFYLPPLIVEAIEVIETEIKSLKETQKK